MIDGHEQLDAWSRVGWPDLPEGDGRLALEEGSARSAAAGDALAASLQFEVRNLGEVTAGKPNDRFEQPVFLSGALGRNRLLIKVSVIKPVNLAGFTLTTLQHMVSLDGANDSKLRIEMPAGWSKAFGGRHLNSWSFTAPASMGLVEVGKQFSFTMDGFGQGSNLTHTVGMRHLQIEFKTNATDWQLTMPVVFAASGDNGKLTRGAVDAGCSQLINATFNVIQNNDRLLVPHKQRNDLFTRDQSGIDILNQLGVFIGNIQSKAISKTTESALYVAAGWWCVPAQTASADMTPQLTLNGASATKWSIEKISPPGSPPYWRLKPGGVNFFDKDEIVSLTFQNVRLNHQQGPSSFLVGYTGLPANGFGCLQCAVNKVEPIPTILWSNPPIERRGIQAESVKCEWDTFGGKVTLHVRGDASWSEARTRKGSFNTTLSGTTVISIQVTNGSGRSTERVLAGFEDLRQFGWGNRFGVWSQMSAPGFDTVQLIITQNEWWVRAKKQGKVYSAVYGIRPTYVIPSEVTHETTFWFSFIGHPYDPLNMYFILSSDRRTVRLYTNPLTEAWRKADLELEDVGGPTIPIVMNKPSGDSIPLTVIDGPPPI